MRRQCKHCSHKWLWHGTQLLRYKLQKGFIINTPGAIIVFFITVLVAAEVLCKTCIGSIGIKTHTTVGTPVEESGFIAFF
ncbi:hypothetical protein D3C72_859480 [compost metagenome]